MSSQFSGLALLGPHPWTRSFRFAMQMAFGGSGLHGPCASGYRRQSFFFEVISKVLGRILTILAPKMCSASINLWPCRSSL